ncbi:MAG: sigma 54-interacting transcriptional regulator [Firmicutes bacterium]|nr:sigma 54-interacting transcriptional regulator [Bacillota bacterium]
MQAQDYAIKALDSVISEGLIIAGRDGIIRLYNQRAREIFHLDPKFGPGHPPGVAEPGDIVMFSTNVLGGDDGGVKPEDLRLFGVDPRGIRPGDAVVAIGHLGSIPGSAVWKASPLRGETEGLLVEFSAAANLALTASINKARKVLGCSVNGISHNYQYQTSAGHLVIVDPATTEVKFYQARGYTARKEDAKSILLGKPFVGKGPSAPRVEAVGRHILDIHPDSIGIQHVVMVLQGKKEAITGVEYEINGIPLRCSVKPIRDDGGIAGVALVVEDLSELRSVSKERDDALFSLHLLESNLGYWATRGLFGKIAGSSRAISTCVNVAQKAAASSSTVLLLGESGTGKGLFARAIHDCSPRREGPFVHVNCAAIPSSLVESELFGYEDGAFTGARRGGSPGKFEMANGGTIFLDEIADLDPGVQAKLLHVLEERAVYRVGGTLPRVIDARVIAATNRDIRSAVASGSFRNDLYWRLNVIQITIPPLRQHKEDIPVLIHSLLPVVAARVRKENVRVADDVYQVFYSYDWPGNVREIENVLESACNMVEDDVITVASLPDYLKNYHTGAETTTPPLESGSGSLREARGQAEKRAIIEAIRASNGDAGEAIRILDIGRTSFYGKLRKYGLLHDRGNGESPPQGDGAGG